MLRGKRGNLKLTTGEIEDSKQTRNTFRHIRKMNWVVYDDGITDVVVFWLL